MSMGANGFLAYLPTVYFPNIDFNNDFYFIPNNGQGISLDYANTHFLFSTGNATSSASTTFFSGSMGVGAPPSGVNGDLTALTITANSINATQIKENGNFLNDIYASKYILNCNILYISNYI